MLPENAPNYTSNKHKLKHFLRQSISCLYTKRLQHTKYIQNMTITSKFYFYQLLNFTILEKFGKIALLYRVKTTIRVHKNCPKSSKSSSWTWPCLFLSLTCSLNLVLGWRPLALPVASWRRLTSTMGPGNRLAPLGWHRLLEDPLPNHQTVADPPLLAGFRWLSGVPPMALSET